ncbi:MAG: response regulator [Vicinamibacterales bacterium]|nr:response regulator [Vicinamibacterales bacterium]
MPPADPAQLSRAESFTRLFEAVHEGVYVGLLGPRDNVTIAANPFLRIMLGYPADTPEASLRPFEPDRFTDEGARTVFIDRLARDGAVTDYLLRLRRADDAVIWAEVTASAAIVEATGQVRIEALMRDVSDRKKLEDQSRDLYHQLLQAEKMAALGTTISGVAHELNNPLATILTWSERLAERDLDASTRRGVDTILHEAERAARIVRNLLTFARKRHTTRTMVDINQVVRETLSLRAYEQRVTNISVIDALASGIPSVFADPHQIQQVLLNLVINAEQAMLTSNGRGTMMVRTWQDPERESIVLEVNDDGPGVAEDVRTKIFDPFFTTKEVGKGTGLGLTVAYAIVEEHGGRMWLVSTPGAGASFYVELPVAGGRLKAIAPGELEDVGAAGVAVPDLAAMEEPAPAHRTGSGIAGAEGFGSSRNPTPRRQIVPPPEIAGAARLDSQAVLIVEDETALASAMAEAFADAGFLVDRAGDGEEAMARLDGGQYDLIISDLKMPRMDGIQLLGALRAQHPEMAGHIMFVTGDVIGTDAERFLADSRCRWLAKPFRLSELLRIAKEVMG